MSINNKELIEELESIMIGDCTRWENGTKYVEIKAVLIKDVIDQLKQLENIYNQ